MVTLVLWNEQLEVERIQRRLGSVRPDRRDVLERPAARRIWTAGTRPLVRGLTKRSCVSPRAGGNWTTVAFVGGLAARRRDPALGGAGHHPARAASRAGIEPGYSTNAVRAAFRLRVNRSAPTSAATASWPCWGRSPFSPCWPLADPGHNGVHADVPGHHRPLLVPGHRTVRILHLHARNDLDRHLAASLAHLLRSALGLLLVALLITFLPSIYGAFSRREAEWPSCRSGPGNPPTAATMLIRYHRIEESQYRLSELWRQWEAWFVDIEETHTTFPILVFFRSPNRTARGSRWPAPSSTPPASGRLPSNTPDPGRAAVHPGRLPGAAPHRRRLQGSLRRRSLARRSDHGRPARNGKRRWTKWLPPAYRCSQTAIRPGKTGKAGGSTMTRCC